MPTNYIPAPNTLEKKIYQLIIGRLDGEGIHSGSYQEKIFELVKKGIGGFIVFGGKKDEIKYFINKIQSISKIPLFIASDIEHGVGQQIKDSTIFPCQMALAAAIDKDRPEDVSILQYAIKAIADEVKDIGINMPLIPVLDVNLNPDNPIICTRAFSDDPEDVAWFGSQYIGILENSGLISCAKHFPGHGDTAIDSHISLPVIDKSYDDLMSVDILPFKEAINTGVSSIMIGHLSIPAIDYKPASLSGKIITGILREKLRFDGLILTDALNMNALKNIEDVPVKCIKAGADILLHPLNVDLTVKEILYAVESKDIAREQIDAAVKRILKTKVNLLNTTTTLERGELKGGKIDYQRHKMLSSQVTAMSVTLVKSTPGLLPILDESKIHVVLAGDDKFFDSSPFRSYFKDVSIINDSNPPSPPFGKGGQEGILKEDRLRSLDGTVTFAIFTSIAAWKGSSGNEKDRINELIKDAKNSIVISFGSPYVLRDFNAADILVAAYDATEQAQKAVIKCLMGEEDFKGRLPVRLNL
ncbi:MAG: glycoside hydrolase family 3 N-terminal domain-containing protein [Nitrospirota bacterium]